MILIVDGREMVRGGLAGVFAREGFPACALGIDDLSDWLAAATEDDLGAVRGVMIGEGDGRDALLRLVRARLAAPVVAINETGRVGTTLDLFAMGFDDVVRVPVHPREALVRLAAAERRARPQPASEASRLHIHFDGRDPLVDGEPLLLPRREKRILEHLARRRGARVTKAQLFNAVYGVMEDEVDEAVVESHVSKLRRKLKARLGFDPIDARRYLGYMLTLAPTLVEASPARRAAALAPVFA